MNTKSYLGNWLESHTLARTQTLGACVCLFIWGSHLLSQTSLLRAAVMISATAHSHGDSDWWSGVLQHTKRAAGETEYEPLLGCGGKILPSSLFDWTLVVCCLYARKLESLLVVVWNLCDLRLTLK